MNFDFLKNMFSGDDYAASQIADTAMTVINPSTGLPMLDDGMGGVDAGGSPFGMDIHSSLSDSFMDDMGSNPWD